MDAATLILETPRLRLREAVLSDSAFFLKLVSDPSWLENIGDRAVHSEEDAKQYITHNIRAPYRALGYGLYVMELKSPRVPIGLCGLVQREYLPEPDLGFALLPDRVGNGFAYEAARAVMSHAREKLGLGQLYAIVKPDNQRSIDLLRRLGFQRERAGVVPQEPDVELYAAASLSLPGKR